MGVAASLPPGLLPPSLWFGQQFQGKLFHPSASWGTRASADLYSIAKLVRSSVTLCLSRPYSRPPRVRCAISFLPSLFFLRRAVATDAHSLASLLLVCFLLSVSLRVRSYPFFSFVSPAYSFSTFSFCFFSSSPLHRPLIFSSSFARLSPFMILVERKMVLQNLVYLCCR